MGSSETTVNAIDLLYGWINNKQKEHDGKAKSLWGSQKPVSPPKYHAALLFLTNRNLREIADTAGVSYTVLRRWKWEFPFHSQMIKNIKDFTEVFCENPPIVTSEMMYQYSVDLLDSIWKKCREKCISGSGNSQKTIEIMDSIYLRYRGALTGHIVYPPEYILPKTTRI